MRRRTFITLAAGGVLAFGWAESPAGASAPDIARRRPSGQPSATRQHPAAVAKIIGYARAQAGKPYLWGGTGPDAYDCSGLAYEAYAAAGITIPRTSQEQWAAGPQVSNPQPGDLVFFPGSDGTWASPGHVGLVTGDHHMIQAYAPGTPIGTYAFGTAAALGGTGPGQVIGFTRPWRTT